MAESPELSESGCADSGPASREEVTHELGAVQGAEKPTGGFEDRHRAVRRKAERRHTTDLGV